MNMTPEELSQNIDRVADGLAPMLANFMNTARLTIAATSVNTYMDESGFINPPYPPRESRSGNLRRLSGRLAASISQARFDGGAKEGIAEVEVTGKGATMRLGTRVPYARVHEEGFSGIVRIPAHWRTIDEAFGKPIPARSVKVSEHRRSVFMPSRPYLQPSLDDNEEKLQETLSEQFQQLVLDSIDGK